MSIPAARSIAFGKASCLRATRFWLFGKVTGNDQKQAKKAPVGRSASNRIFFFFVQVVGFEFDRSTKQRLKTTKTQK